MTIEAAVAHCLRIGFFAAGREASPAGGSFTEAELAAVLQAHEMLVRVRQDAPLREEVVGAERPMEALMAIANRSGRDLRPEAVSVLLRALQGSAGELETHELDRVAGGARYALPEVDDEVLVAFAHGDTRSPYVIGSLWKGDKPPT
jgi:hypothetical protein